MSHSIHSLARIGLAALLLTTLAACSQLSVEVDVLRPEVVSARVDADAIARVMPQIVAEDDLTVQRAFADQINAHSNAYAELAAGYRADAKKLPKKAELRQTLEDAALSLDGGLTPDVRAFYTRKEAEVKAVNAALRTSWTEFGTLPESPQRAVLVKRMLADLANRQALLSAVYAEFSHDLDERVSAKQELASSVPPGLLDNAEKRARSGLKQLFDGGGLIDSRYTYYVVRAPKEEWASMFDRTLARGLFGNTDIAIKALAPGNFTIKGLSFNPADVAAAASKVGAQTVLLAAQIAGVPVNLAGSPEPGTNGGAIATSSTNLSKILADTAKNTEKVRAHKDALLRIAASILQERDSIANGTSAERKAAVDSIKAVYESHAARIAISSN